MKNALPWFLASLLLAAGTASPAAPDKAVFAGGCFWSMQHDLEQVPGVLSVVAGYTGGEVPHPTYEEVCSGATGHVEAVEVTFDPGKISYAALLDRYWHLVDPTTRDRQFCDAGAQYQSEIFYGNDAQRRAAEESLARLSRDKPFRAPIVTEIRPAVPFYRAEEYHQDYWKKNPLRYRLYRAGCGRDGRLRQLWGPLAGR